MRPAESAFGTRHPDMPALATAPHAGWEREAAAIVAAAELLPEGEARDAAYAPAWEIEDLVLGTTAETVAGVVGKLRKVRGFAAAPGLVGAHRRRSGNRLDRPSRSGDPPPPCSAAAPTSAGVTGSPASAGAGTMKAAVPSLERPSPVSA
jgi:hypothetical protein